MYRLHFLFAWLAALAAIVHEALYGDDWWRTWMSLGFSSICAGIITLIAHSNQVAARHDAES